MGDVGLGNMKKLHNEREETTAVDYKYILLVL